jgi:transcription termination factor Rho
MTKEQTVSEETPRKRRAPKAVVAEPEAPARKSAPKKRAKAEVEAVPEPAKAASKKKSKAEEPAEAPRKEVPAKEAPAKEASAKEASAKEASAKEAPAKGAPAKEKSAKAAKAAAAEAPERTRPAPQAPVAAPVPRASAAPSMGESPVREIPASREVPASREDAPREHGVRASEPRDISAERAAPSRPIGVPSEPQGASAVEGAANPQSNPQFSSGQPQGHQHPRHPRHERHRNRHGNPNQPQQHHGQPGQKQGQHQHGQHQQGQHSPQSPNQGQPVGSGGAPVNAGGPQPGQQNPGGGAPFQPGQPGQPGLPGQGRRRRRRGRGGGGGQPGGPGQQHGGGQQQPMMELQPFLGLLEMDDRGFGRLRRADKNFLASESDPDVPKQIVERYRLRPGALVQAGVGMKNGKPSVMRVDQVEGVSPEEAQNRLSFMNLTSIDPDRRIVLETTSGEYLTRIIDLIAPIGFGQRGLIVAPPKTGKTIILQKIAKAVLTNHPKAKLMVLLIDERPEEVTDFRRSIGADVYASSSDRPAHEHLRIAEMVMERARRLVEAGEDVVVLLDSITRLARAYNKEIESSGRTMSGGVDSRALERPKRLFGAARNTEEAGSLTILGTALIDTGSRMDEVIFEEFKGTGNMEIVLDRALAERRLWPAININNSGTRKEEKLFSVRESEKNRKLRAYLSALRPIEAMEKLLSRVRDFRSNGEFYDAL